MRTLAHIVAAALFFGCPIGLVFLAIVQVGGNP
jgi:uncharacterized membrane protein